MAAKRPGNLTGTSTGSGSGLDATAAAGGQARGAQKTRTEMIDEKISFEFLKAAYFGYYDGCDSYALAGRRAYRDMCRTIEFPETGRSRAEAEEYELKKMELRRRVIGWLREEVRGVAAEEFDAWHEAMCERIGRGCGRVNGGFDRGLL